jgi:hypothetical protein
MVYRETEIILVIKKISLARLNEGGAAILADRKRNHHMAREGLNIIIPLVKNLLRVCVAEYEIFAKANRAAEQSPWAIIMMIAPFMPHDVKERIPAIMRPIWPTEE